jgi:hypothetical protein
VDEVMGVVDSWLRRGEETSQWRGERMNRAIEKVTRGTGDKNETGAGGE